MIVIITKWFMREVYINVLFECPSLTFSSRSLINKMINYKV